MNGRTGYQIINGENYDISIFRFYWFEPIWLYNPSSSFPMNEIEADFFLNITDNTGYGFSYEILTVSIVNKTPKHRNLVALTRSVVRSCVVEPYDAPSLV